MSDFTPQGDINLRDTYAINNATNIEDGAEVNNISDINATDLTDGGDTTLHDHDGISENTSHRGSAGGTDHSDVSTNNSKVSNVSTNLSEGTSTETTVDVNSSDGSNATLASASTSRAGLLTKAKWDEIVANTSDSHAQSHNIASHSDTTATGTELDTLTGGGDTTLHDHDGISENTSARHTQNTDTALGSGAVSADHGAAATDQVINVCYGTGAPPAANTTTIGALFVKYTA